MKEGEIRVRKPGEGSRRGWGREYMKESVKGGKDGKDRPEGEEKGRREID